MKRLKRCIADQIKKRLFPLGGKSGRKLPVGFDKPQFPKVTQKAHYRKRCGVDDESCIFGIDESARLWKAVNKEIEGERQARMSTRSSF